MKYLSALAIFFILASQGSVACKCSDSGLQEKFENSGLVFVGMKVSTQVDHVNREMSIFLVAESLKGPLHPGDQIAINTLKGTSCEAYVPDDYLLLAFASGTENNNFMVSKCSLLGAEPMTIEGQTHHPSEQMLEFIESAEKSPIQPGQPDH